MTFPSGLTYRKLELYPMFTIKLADPFLTHSPSFFDSDFLLSIGYVM